MPIVAFLGWRGMVGIAGMLLLSLLLVVQKGETRHWHKMSDGWEHKFNVEHEAFGQTVTNYRAAAVAARAADQANIARVQTEQRATNERTDHDFQARLAAARAVAQRVRDDAARGANPGAGGAAPVSTLSPATGVAAGPAAHDRLSDDERLTATEQAIQLDELIKWVRAQAAVKP